MKKKIKLNMIIGILKIAVGMVLVRGYAELAVWLSLRLNNKLLSACVISLLGTIVILSYIRIFWKEQWNMMMYTEAYFQEKQEKLLDENGVYLEDGVLKVKPIEEDS